MSVAPIPVCPSVGWSYFWISILSASLRPHKAQDDIVVADMAADMVADMEVDMVADMEVNMVADLVADKKNTQCFKGPRKCYIFEK